MYCIEYKYWHSYCWVLAQTLTVRGDWQREGSIWYKPGCWSARAELASVQFWPNQRGDRPNQESGDQGTG